MKQLLALFGAALLLSSCNKDSTTDSFCTAVAQKDWESVETVLSAESDNYTDTVWQENAIKLCKTLNEKECVDTAYARLYMQSSSTTEIVLRYIVNDSIIQRVESFYVSSAGILTVKTKFTKTN